MAVRFRPPLALLPFVACALMTSAVRADEPRDSEPPPERPVPDYDGRPPPPSSAAQRALWIPRVVLFPIYVVSEYVVRRPLGWVVSTAEEQEIPAKIMDILTFGPEGQGTWAPTFFFDFGFRPSVGLFFRWEEFLAEDNELLLHGGTWGRDWLTGTVADRIEPSGAPWELQLRVEATRRPDGLFFGIGRENRDELESRYQFRLFDAEVGFETDPFWRTSNIAVWLGVRDMEFGSDTCCSGPPIPVRVENGELDELPPGFADGYLVYRQGIRAVFDTRPPRPEPGTGIRLELQAEHAFDLRAPVDRRWVTYGGAVGLHADLTGDQNVLSATLSAAVADRMDGEIPFTELIDLSGDGPMQGFVEGRLLGDSGAALTFEYRWPVWIWLDASAHVALGNVYEGRFADLDLDNVRLSWGLGLKSSGERDQSFSLLLAFGTGRLDEGADVESVRFVFGGTRAF